MAPVTEKLRSAVLLPSPRMFFEVYFRKDSVLYLCDSIETQAVDVREYRRALKSTSVLRSARPGVSSGCTKRCWAMPL